MNKYKTFGELKEELGDKFEDYMYKANVELLNKLDKIKEIMEADLSNMQKLIAINIILKKDELLEEV